MASHRILVVDDNPSIHSDFRKILCADRSPDEGAAQMEAILFNEVPRETDTVSFQLDSAFQGQEALEKLQAATLEHRPYSLAFVDVRMPPGWDGIETISRLWKVDPTLQVVICTAYSDYSWDEMRARLGQPDCLVVLKKPFDNVEVQQLAHALTRKWELARRAELQLQDLEQMVLQRTAELRKTNEDLTKSEERFAKAFHTSPVGMAIQTLPDQRFVDANKAMLQLTGLAQENLVGASAADLFLWKAPAVVDAWVDGLLRNESPAGGETELLDGAGNVHQVLVSMSLVTFDGRSHVLMVVQDMTERVLLERQLRQAQRMEAIGQLAAGVAHDFNNILTVISGHAGLLKTQIQAGRAGTESADKIFKAVDRAAGLIRQLLLFSRKQVTQFRYIDINETISRSVAMISRLLGEHVRLEFVPQPQLAAIHGDAVMLEQIIMNLAVNARDAMPNGGQVVIQTDLVQVNRCATPLDPHERAGAFVRLIFRDTGSGMNTAVLNRLFEPFFTTKPVGKGAGLGLSTVFGIVRQHNGWIEVASKPDQGTTFELFFPASSKPAEHITSAFDTGMLLGGRETVLVVEDEEALREMVGLVLTAQGYKVLCASSGVDALRLYEQAHHRIDLLLTDLVMPGGVMGGELATRLQAQNPDLKVVFTSGYSPGIAGKDLSLLDGRNFLPKPYAIGKLAQVVREALDRPAKGPEPADAGQPETLPVDAVAAVAH
jgi:two-component system, cell cycle sensor histidine kinase and response regulator CckA